MDETVRGQGLISPQEVSWLYSIMRESLSFMEFCFTAISFFVVIFIDCSAKSLDRIERCNVSLMVCVCILCSLFMSVMSICACIYVMVYLAHKHT